jgi:prephenate dehydrogenase
MITTAAILGFGRFGAALAERLLEADVELRVHDSVVAPPDAIAVATPREAVRDVQLVILAVPVCAIAEVLEQIRPALHAGQVVIDVASVKSGPSAMLQTALGSAIPWVATHPLFGPISLARGERPLKVVVCPNLQHPEAVEQVSGFFWNLGFNPVSLDPESHDREMAATHALAFFIAKGFLDADLLLHSDYAPPSVWGMRRMLESVQADAGQLYATLQLDNPYAAGMRRRLLSALTGADDALRDAARGVGGSADAALSIPNTTPGPVSPLLDKARESIDEIDKELVALLARRAQLSIRAGRVKAEIGHGVRDPQREASLLEERRGMASELGLDPAAVEEVFQSILCLSRDFQSRELEKES